MHQFLFETRWRDTTTKITNWRPLLLISYKDMRRQTSYSYTPFHNIFLLNNCILKLYDVVIFFGTFAALLLINYQNLCFCYKLFTLLKKLKAVLPTILSVVEKKKTIWKIKKVTAFENNFPVEKVKSLIYIFINCLKTISILFFL